MGRDTIHAVYYALAGLMFGWGQHGGHPQDVDVEALFRAMEILETRLQSELAPLSHLGTNRSVPGNRRQFCDQPRDAGDLDDQALRAHSATASVGILHG